MSNYDERLEEFVWGRTLIRLTPSVVNRRAMLCDACGSHQPRVLHSLKDPALGRHFFVGQSCLQALTERGALSRRAVRASTGEAYEAEYDRRQAEAAPESELTPVGATGLGAPSGAMLLVAVLGPGEWAAVLEVVGADRDACLVVPLGDALPGFTGAALPLTQLHELAQRAERVRQSR